VRHHRSVAYSVELVLLNKHQVYGGAPKLHWYPWFFKFAIGELTSPRVSSPQLDWPRVGLSANCPAAAVKVMVWVNYHKKTARPKLTLSDKITLICWLNILLNINPKCLHYIKRYSYYPINLPANYKQLQLLPAKSFPLCAPVCKPASPPTHNAT